MFRPSGWPLRNAYIFAILLCFFAATPAHADDRAKATELVQKSAAQSQLSDLKEPYTLKVSFRVPGEHGTEGTYQYWSLSHMNSRTEINARGFHSVEVGQPDRRWEKADLPYTPQPIEMLERMIASGTAFDWPLHAKEIKVKKERDGLCAIFKNEKKSGIDVCFDPDTSLLRTVSDERGSRFEFHEYESLAGRKVARRMQYFDSGILVVDAKLDALTTMPAIDSALFTPPPGAEAWDWCPNMEPPKMIRSVHPKMPRGAWGGYSQFWMVIDTEGHVEQGGLMTSAGPALDRAAADAMKQWLFRPAMCNGMPIRVKTTASFSFGY